MKVVRWRNSKTHVVESERHCTTVCGREYPRDSQFSHVIWKRDLPAERRCGHCFD